MNNSIHRRCKFRIDTVEQSAVQNLRTQLDVFDKQLRNEYELLDPSNTGTFI